MAQKPRHDDDGSYCPQWRKLCSKVCHTCELWMPLNVKDIRTGEQQDIWNCAFKWQAMLAVDIKQVTSQAGSATESLRNELVSRIDRPRQLQQQVNGGEVRRIETHS